MEKLLWFNREYLKRMPLTELLGGGIDTSGGRRCPSCVRTPPPLTDLREYMEMFDRAELGKARFATS
jgi:hypothetical protein